MADEVITPTPVVEAAPVVAPTIPLTVSQEPVQAPTEVVATPVPENPETPVSEAPSASTDASRSDLPVSEAAGGGPSETVLGEALTPQEQAPVQEAPKEGEQPAQEAPQNEGGQSDDPAPPPKYDPFTLPEGISLDESRVGEFTNLLAELETSGKASHEAVQAFGQKAVEFHINEVRNAVEGITKIYQEAWDKQKTDWKEAFLKDPEIGGNRFQTTVDSALTFIRTHGGTPEQQAEFRALMETSGLGNHPVMIRMLANAGRAMQEGKPLAAPKPVPQQKSKTQTLYGKG